MKNNYELYFETKAALPYEAKFYKRIPGLKELEYQRTKYFKDAKDLLNYLESRGIDAFNVSLRSNKAEVQYNEKV